MLNRILGFIAGILCLAIIVGSAYSYISGPSVKKSGDKESASNISRGKENNVDAYTAIGQLRITLQPENEGDSPDVVVVNPWFSYAQGDKSLFEELSQKDVQIKNLIVSYFSSYTLDDLRSKDEQTIKEDLLHIINGILVIGKIRSVYFNDYIFID